MSEVFGAIVQERAYQDKKHGSIQENPHEMGTWLLLIEAELTEAKNALIKNGTGRDSVRSELIQMAALCVATLQQFGVGEPVQERRLP